MRGHTDESGNVLAGREITGVGVDIIRVERIRKASETSGVFLERNFTERELEYCLSRASQHKHIAARFAAKEAVSKALGSSFRPSEVEVTHDGKGIPTARLLGRTLKENRDTELFLSLSHDGEHAIAFCVAIR
ncbi:MAG: holo-ACP synthase [Actinobacteria bacterium]|nr:holo-ACP synthase [Actinomycetota bacterium]MBU4403457.1 holo-ACP synthase [Actinomycetota bacterium]MBU4441447.1 holo-ACP synthase [Actinomycetota bacterium]